MGALMQLVADLERGSREQKRPARAAVEEGEPIRPWLDALPITPQARARVITLLEHLASAVPPWG
jgi:hypothetical protein